MASSFVQGGSTFVFPDFAIFTIAPFPVVSIIRESALLNLYSTVYNSEDEANSKIADSLEKGMPLNLATGEFDGKVLCSIETDVAILEAISKVIMVMFTANQALLESPMNNVYLTDKEN